MEPKTVYFLTILISVGLELIADYLFKTWVTANKAFIFWIGVVIYAIGTIFWALSLKYESLSRAGIFFNIVYLAMIVVISIIIFRETVTWREILALLLCIGAILLLELK